MKTSSQILDEGKKLRELRGEQAVLQQQNELLRQEQRELLDANSDIVKRLLTNAEDSDDIKRLHSEDIQAFEGRNVVLLDEILERQGALKALLDGISQSEQTAGQLTEDIERKKRELSTLETKNEVTLRKLKGAISEVVALENKLLQEVAIAREELKTVRTEFIATKHDTEERIKVVEKEERLISIRRNDLEIYERRLRKQYPDAKLIFTT